jgi:hypothetical protein
MVSKQTGVVREKFDPIMAGTGKKCRESGRNCPATGRGCRRRAENAVQFCGWRRPCCHAGDMKKVLIALLVVAAAGAAWLKFGRAGVS